MLRRRLTKGMLMLPILVYTAFSAGPYLWTAVMSLRTTDEIYRSHYGLPIPAHWGKFYVAWTEFGYDVYFRNSAIVAVAAVILITIVGAMAGFGFARKRYVFPLRQPLFLLIFLSVMFPPQIMILSARIDGCTDWTMFWRVMFPIALPAVATTFILDFIYFWNEFLYAVVFITQQEIRTLPLAIQFLVSDQYQDIGMLATGLMIATLPILIMYLFLSEWFVKGMTAGAVKG